MLNVQSLEMQETTSHYGRRPGRLSAGQQTRKYQQASLHVSGEDSSNTSFVVTKALSTAGNGRSKLEDRVSKHQRRKDPGGDCSLWISSVHQALKGPSRKASDIECGSIVVAIGGTSLHLRHSFSMILRI